MRTLSNHNRLLYSYEGCIGIKTGFTKKSGRCLVSAAERDGVTLVAVTLNAKSDWMDHKKLLDYGFSFMRQVEPCVNLRNIKLRVVGGNKTSVSVRYLTDTLAIKTISETDKIVVRVFIKHFEYAPVEKGEIVGSIKYLKDDIVIKETAIVAGDYVEALTPDSPQNDNIDESYGFCNNIIRKIKEFFKRG
jgi:D-alanyl-D-alanine carboxypeptidase/D-alanyl-D-alanine carboxypeptidase (penicillin-binding protein 5/6)